MNKRETLKTEQQNINSKSIDEFSISKILKTTQYTKNLSKHLLIRKISKMI